MYISDKHYNILKRYARHVCDITGRKYMSCKDALEHLLAQTAEEIDLVERELKTEDMRGNHDPNNRR